MNEPSPRSRLVLPALMVGGLVARLAAAVLVEGAARRRGSLCLFDDTAIYWELAGAIRAGRPFSVDQFGVPHLALRTPGYPLFLAGCQAVFGPTNTLAVRVVQAILGAGCVGLVDGLTKQVLGNRSAARVAAGIAAFEPFWAGTSALILSEAVFVPFLLLMLWGLAALWSPGPRRPVVVAMFTGAAAGAAVLVKPSFALAVPILPMAWLATARDGRSLRLTLIVGLGAVVVMAPWWARNARVLGRFVPTASWGGASLFDGLNPSADGSSDMRFLARPEVRGLPELDQDAFLTKNALEFAREHPWRVARLALIKAGRFWSPWPNAESFRSRTIAAASAAVSLPLFFWLALGAWKCRNDVRALVLLGGPLLYFFALHLVFVSSIRYRIPGMVPAFGLVAAGLVRGGRDSG